MDIKSTFNKFWKPGFGSILLDEGEFLSRAIVEGRPKLFVEVGTATGFSTGFIASCMEEASGAGRLLSFDLNRQFYGDLSKKVGYLATEIYQGDKIDIQIHSRRTAFDLAEFVQPGSIDMAFIDAHHFHPWPTLDTIAMLPFMRPHSLMFHHDVALYRDQDEVRGIGPKYLFDQIPVSLKGLSPNGRSNIFYIAAPNDYRSLESSLIDALLLPWTPGLRLPPQHINQTRAIIRNHWSVNLLRAFNTSLRRFGNSLPTKEASVNMPNGLSENFVEWGMRRFSAEYRDVFAYQLPRLTFKELSPLRDLLRGKTKLTVVDIGANHGIWSRAFLDCYGDLVERLFLVEPLDGNNAVLDKRIREGFFEFFPDKLIRLKVAAGGKDGVGEIRFDTKASALASLCLTESVFGQNRIALPLSQSVTIQSMETIMRTNNIDFIDVLKIDTEGFELDILRGAASLLKQRKIGIICFEFGVNQVRMRHSFEDFWKLFSEFGYRMTKFNGDYLNGKMPINKYSTALEDFTKNIMLCAVVESWVVS